MEEILLPGILNSRKFVNAASGSTDPTAASGQQRKNRLVRVDSGDKVDIGPSPQYRRRRDVRTDSGSSVETAVSKHQSSYKMGHVARGAKELIGLLST